MTCEDCEARVLDALTEPGDQSPELAEHLAGCEGCRAFAAETAEALELAAPPALTAQDQAALAALPGSTLAAWRDRHQPRGLLQRVLSLAVAAALGGLIASTALLSVGAGAGSDGAMREVAVVSVDTGWNLTEEEDSAAALPAEDEFDPSGFEVSWTGEY
jgi:hypothetical protein